MKEYIINFKQTDLASRTLARAYRNDVESNLRANFKIIIDLDGVLSISESFSDELFGVIVAKYGVNTLTSNIKIINVDNTTIRSIASVVNRRVLEQKNKGSVKANDYNMTVHYA